MGWEGTVEQARRTCPKEGSGGLHLVPEALLKYSSLGGVTFGDATMKTMHGRPTSVVVAS